ncbi:MAG: diguanylate cyclase response regulator [Nitrospinaceae bacterium]|nr:MAG: diguanylate cyclase response regulator [Nitrospinaceae bacterium]
MNNKAQNIKLLIVDDDPEDRYAYKRMLKQINGANWTVLEAETGDEGLDLFKLEKPDCVLLDYILPDIDGLEFLLQMKKISATPSLPVVMLTGQGDETVAVLAMKEGASNYLVKGALTPASLKTNLFHCIKISGSANSVGALSKADWNKKKKVELISEIQNLKEKLETSSGIDPLTGLPNRTNMLGKLHYEKCRFERNKKPFSMIMADIDNFSVIHQSYDARKVNEVMAQTGKFLDFNSRKQDVVSYWGKERFLLLLPETGLEGATVLIEKLCAKIESGGFPHPDQTIPVTMSFRAGAYSDETMEIEDCILEADGCLM